MPVDTARMLVIFIEASALVITGIFLAAVLRRAASSRRYRKLDRYREQYGKSIKAWIDRGSRPGESVAFLFRTGSTRWRAVEDVLSSMAECPEYARAAVDLFDRLGYRTHYEGKLDGSVIARSSAAEMLGRMRCAASTGRLVNLLGERDPEVVAVAVRALSRIGTPEVLQVLLDRLPSLISRALVAKKSLETSLGNFGEAAVPKMVRCGKAYSCPVARATILEVLESLPTRDAVRFALESLTDADPEVRAKALKIVGAAGATLPDRQKDTLLPLVDDPVWFVRLQAVKTLGKLRYGPAERPLERRLRDEKWQVRNAAAEGLIQASGNAVDIFLAVLRDTDRYARDSVCEEIQRTGFMFRLIDDMRLSDGEKRWKSRELLRLMDSLGFGTPLREYLETGSDGRVREDLSLPQERMVVS